ncbi:hypothetical protein A3Q56_08418 [Intoshia linei]|uniref:Hydantoinase/oxoprolinase N-terminal domain-containing protein n=1 Tax=Intoshia linei TaxID=1819745 RepID=A0A177AR39_9BILA|nr:hypothetical protein A3Q56_08418 [Intoshia linei]
MFKFAIDRGGTFTDIYCTLPNGNIVTEKLLSDNIHYNDAPAEGIRQIMHKYGQLHDTTDFADELIDGTKIKSIRMGTTVATNALLESNGEPCCLVTTKGFKDIIKIGNQSRSDLFAMVNLMVISDVSSLPQIFC